MKLTKILGLAVVAVVAVTAFAGSASAARLHPLIRLCKTQTLLLCSAANSVTLPETAILKGLQIGTGILEGTLNQKCTGGTITGKLKLPAVNMVEGPGAEESKLLGQINSLTFTGCEPCKKIVASATEKEPFTSNLKMTSEKEVAPEWTLEGSGNAKFEECPFGIGCKFGAKELVPAPIIEMTATEAIVNTNKAVLNREEGSEFFCGNSGKWNAKYKLELELTVGGTLHNVWPTLCKALSETCV